MPVRTLPEASVRVKGLCAGAGIGGSVCVTERIAKVTRKAATGSAAMVQRMREGARRERSCAQTRSRSVEVGTGARTCRSSFADSSLSGEPSPPSISRRGLVG